MCKLESKLKMPEEGSGGEGFNLDGILSELGSFGKYQLLLLLLLAFRDSFLSMCNFNYVFTAAETPFRCKVPECEPLDSRYNASWVSFTLDSQTEMCYRLAPYITGSNDVSVRRPQWNATSQLTEVCTPESFVRDEVVPCEGVVYEDYNSITAEARVTGQTWAITTIMLTVHCPSERVVACFPACVDMAIAMFDLGCEPWKRTLIGTVHNLGLVFSFILSGIISDRYGRKVVIVVTPLVVGAAGLLKSFAMDYWTLLVLEFLETALGYGNASMVLSLEAVSQSSRVVYSCMSDILATLGGACFGLVAWKVPYWRDMMRAIYAPLLVVVFYIFLVDEGVRWLLAHNRRHEAVRVLNKVAKVNNITLSHKAKAMLQTITAERSKSDEAAQPIAQETPQIFSVLRSKKILLRLALISACFFCCMFVYSGAIINSASISGNKYLNYSAMMLVAVPTRVITAYTLTRFGRKAPICVAYCLCALFFIASAFVPKSIGWASMLFYLAGMMSSSYGIFSIQLVAMEVFPTTSRNSLTNIANTVGRLGSALAPQAPLLEKFMPSLPSLVFGVVALGPAVLAFLLPDTSRSTLPDQLADAERLDDDSERSHTSSTTTC